MPGVTPRRGRPARQAVDLDALAVAARDGDRVAVEALLGGLSDDLYRLALRMVWHPQDAQDATQEILVKVLTGLSTWRGDASVRTWAWRVAVRHLLDRRPSRMEEARWTFEGFADDLATGLADTDPARRPDAELLAEEVRLGCTLCARRVDQAVVLRRVDPERMLFAEHPAAPAAETLAMTQLHDAAALMRAHPAYATPDQVVDGVRRVLDVTAGGLLDEP
jgi:DNA-directed RNA polymerase specialized sigma24 family protein